MKATLVLTCFDGDPPRHLSDALVKVSTNNNTYFRGFFINRDGVSCAHHTFIEQPECDTIWILSDNFLNDKLSNDFLEVLKNFDQLLVALHKGAQLYNTTRDKFIELCNFIPDVYITETHHVPSFTIPDLCNTIVGRALEEDNDRVMELHKELNNFICKYNTYKKS